MRTRWLKSQLKLSVCSNCVELKISLKSSIWGGSAVDFSLKKRLPMTLKKPCLLNWEQNVAVNSQLKQRLCLKIYKNQTSLQWSIRKCARTFRMMQSILKWVSSPEVPGPSPNWLQHLNCPPSCKPFRQISRLTTKSAIKANVWVSLHIWLLACWLALSVKNRLSLLKFLGYKLSFWWLLTLIKTNWLTKNWRISPGWKIVSSMSRSYHLLLWSIKFSRLYLKLTKKTRRKKATLKENLNFLKRNLNWVKPKRLSKGRYAKRTASP